MENIDYLCDYDPEVGQAMQKELDRQRHNIELIASENIVSEAVLTNKYAEGYPGKRYYGGCECVDIVENIARDRAKKLFGAEHVNVQPHSGAQANLAVYFALLNPGDTVMGMSLAEGGHFVPYGINSETGRLDYDALETLVKEHKPKLVVAGASAYPRVIDFERIANIAHANGALLMVDMAHIAGLVAAGLHPSPFPFADIVTTTTHKTLRGPRGGMIMCKEEFAKAIDKAIFPGTQGGPLMHVIAGKAVCFGEALKPGFKEYQKQVLANSKALADALLGYGFDLVSGGSDNHLILVDLRTFNVTGKEMEKKLDEVRITANKNAIPNDPQSPFITSGVRLGTPAVTSRGFDEDDMRVVAECIYNVASGNDTKENILAKVDALCKKHPIYED